MKKRALGIVAASAFAIAAIGAPVAADQGGVPNDDACHGQIVAAYVSAGGSLQDAADFFGFETVGDLHKFVKAVCDL
jgi:hypothetical protein